MPKKIERMTLAEAQARCATLGFRLYRAPSGPSVNAQRDRGAGPGVRLRIFTDQPCDMVGLVLAAVEAIAAAEGKAKP